MDLAGNHSGGSHQNGSTPHVGEHGVRKIQLVQAYLDGEGSARAIATRHGVPHSLLMIWVKKPYGEGELTEEIHLQEQVVEDQAKIAAPRAQDCTGQLTMELDAMKKRVSETRQQKSAAVVDHLLDQGVSLDEAKLQPHELELARSTFYKRPEKSGLRDRARERTDADLRVRIEDILAEFYPPTDIDGLRTSSGDAAW